MGRRFAVHGLGTALLSVMLAPGHARADACAPNWPLWQDFVKRFVQEDGRMLGSSMNPNQSSSEGQSYGMFFALVANDRTTFDKLWRWSRDNLAGNDIGQNLPAWLWGERKDKTWGIIDRNSASDADLWFAYALLEADRLWGGGEYRKAAASILNNVRSTLVRDIPGLGPTVLPGPEGYEHPDQLWRLNASYLPLPLLRRLDKADPAGEWNDVAASTVKMIGDKTANPYGFVPDWIGYRGTGANNGRFGTDPYSNDIGSYDAIRVYLWAGMTPVDEPLRKNLLKSLDGMAKATEEAGAPPEKVHVQTRTLEGRGYYGFSAAMIPLLRATGRDAAAEQQARIVEQALSAYRDPGNAAYNNPQYYHVMLSLFSQGFSEQRYRFNGDGTVNLSWKSPCASTL